eukprot:CAMPEP_0184861430 /NCGR_PEP_ID=MMETSP0580-20130426/6118_1 /TAXON_ID=1118495 /ORGANISM="Dactyliosolen fragilissimus" /LENGTH=71 /DNA_ID=CAMNT_0027358925 /DNA_START=253 /DNA_END=468 /DNA_ORIENTATION=-
MAILVPRRRRMGGAFSLMSIPLMALKIFDADFVFKKTRVALLYGFAPAVVCIGMMTEPKPGSWLELINILE